jgi:hypothetical protein
MICEELGLLIGLCAMAAVLILAFFALRSARNGRSAYYAIASCAAMTMLLFQMGLNVFGSMDLLPFTGVTFPFVSRGGSSLMSCWGLLAFIKAGDTRRQGSFALGKGRGKKPSAPAEKPGSTKKPTAEKKPAPAKKPAAAKKTAPAQKSAAAKKPAGGKGGGK